MASALKIISFQHCIHLMKDLILKQDINFLLILHQQAARIETDSFGEIEVPADKYCVTQTARSKLNFPIGDETQHMLVS